MDLIERHARKAVLQVQHQDEHYQPTPDEANALENMRFILRAFQAEMTSETTTAPRLIERFNECVQLAVAELPDRTSPDDQPDMMLLTHEELAFILQHAWEHYGMPALAAVHASETTLRQSDSNNFRLRIEAEQRADRAESALEALRQEHADLQRAFDALGAEATKLEEDREYNAALWEEQRNRADASEHAAKRLEEALQIRTGSVSLLGVLQQRDTAQQTVRTLTDLLKVFVAAKEEEAQIDTRNFPDETDYGRFWTQQLVTAKAALAHASVPSSAPPTGSER